MTFTFDTRSLVWIIPLGLFSFLFIVLLYRRYIGGLNPRTGRGLTLLRLSSVGLLLFLLCEPAGKAVLNRSEPARVMLFVDQSESMGITDRLGDRREAVRNFLESATVQELSGRYHLESYRFAGELSPLNRLSADSLTISGEGTDIGRVMDFIKTRSYTDSLAGVILVTDGNATVGRDPLRAAAGLRVPVFTVGVGDTLEMKDAAITSHLTNDVAYINSRVPIEITVTGIHLDQTRIPITLLEGDKVLDTQTVTLTGDGQTHSVTLNFLPTTEGVHRLSARIPAQEGEITLQNNVRNFSIKARKDKLAVLYIEGSPRADMGFIKRTLERDPNIEVVSLFFRPDGSVFPSGLPDTRMDWFDYDLLILGSVDAARLQPWERHIIDFVEQKGGGLVALGGSRSFDLGGYSGTGLGRMMPVYMENSRGSMIEGMFSPVLTPDGEAHPIMRVENDATLSRRKWAELPPLPRFNAIGPAKPGATTLAVHPSWAVEGKPAPLIATQTYGNGRVMVIGFQDMWRWDLMMWGVGSTDAVFERFWSNTVRWMTTREANDGVQVTATRQEYRSGEPVVFIGRIQDENYQPVDNASVSLTVRAVHTDSAVAQIPLPSAEEGNGRYAATLNPLPPGAYAYEARVSRDGVLMGSDTGGFVIGGNGLEYDRSGLDTELLTALSGMTGGRFYRIEEADRLSRETNFPAHVVQRLQTVELWRHPFLLILLVLLLAGEWLLRRRSGLL